MDTKATETDAAAIAPQTMAPVVDDAEARYQALETEKENYRKAYLKEVNKNKGAGDPDPSEDADEKMRRIAQEALADSRLAEIAKEQNDIIQKTLKENKELKLAHLNKTGAPPAAMGTHSETQAVQDTLVTPEQMNYFKNVLKWDEKTIENYKKNVRRKM